jgi:hypothetical protein
MASGEDEVEGGRSKRRRVWREENLTGGLVHVRGLFGSGWMDGCIKDRGVYGYVEKETFRERLYEAHRLLL